jgi:molybdopterin molybdotransferase
VTEGCETLGARAVTIGQALGHVLAETIKAPEPSPRFDNTAMDGFAVRGADTTAASDAKPVRLKIADSVFAGEVSGRRLGEGEACRIMTGAPIPRGADAVAQKEEVSVDGGSIVIDHPIARGRHIRRRGEEIKKGTVVLRKGLALDAGGIGFLASLGRQRARVYRKPAVSVIATGDETVAPGNKLAPGQIYDSNSYMLTAALRQMGIEPKRVRHVRDHPTALNNAVAAALRVSDALIVTGGISVGDHDYLRDVLTRLRVREVFWRVKQKPGKPLYFGKKGNRAVFGLPGNPASVYTCFWLYVYPALRRMAGFGDAGLPERKATLAADVQPDALRWRFLKARTIEGPQRLVEALPRQASHMISDLVGSDCLIVAPPGPDRIPAGTEVTTYVLPFSGGFTP